jgi:hypothetical protein
MKKIFIGTVLLIGIIIGSFYWNGDVNSSVEPGTSIVRVATIANGESLSNVINVDGFKYFRFYMPSSWTAANLTFKESYASDKDYQDMYDDASTEVNIPVSTSRVVVADVNALKLAGAKYIKLRSGTTGTPVNQAAERKIYIVLKN